MDMRVYYRKIQENIARINDTFVVVKSLETPDGGKPGVYTEVSKRNAAILITEGRAELAGPDETRVFRENLKSAKLAVDREEAARRVQLTLVNPTEVQALKFGPSANEG